MSSAPVEQSRRLWARLLVSDSGNVRLEYVAQLETVVAIDADGSLLVRTRGGPIHHTGRLSSLKVGVVPAWRAVVPAERHRAMLRLLVDAAFPIGRAADALVPDELPSFVTLEHRDGERATMSAFDRTVRENLALGLVLVELRGLAAAVKSGPPTDRLPNPELDQWRSMGNCPSMADDFVPRPSADAGGRAQVAVDRFYAQELGPALARARGMHQHLASRREQPPAGASPGLESPRAEPAEPTPAGPAPTNPLASRVREGDVAAVLSIIAAPPKTRTTRQPGDLAGDYDQWFDGGAIRVGTGTTTFVFINGVQAHVAASSPTLSVVIRFRDGRTVRVEQG